jgi:hypothetical protein
MPKGISIMADNPVNVVAGVDAHWAAIITTTGQRVADNQSPATPDGYARLAGFIAVQPSRTP